MNNTSTEQLFKFDQNVEVIHTLMESEEMYVVLKVCSTHARCPGCKCLSPRRHSQYARKADGLPILECLVHLTNLLFKLFCVNTTCKNKIFSEPLNWLNPSRRKTVRLKNCFVTLYSQIIA